MKTTALEMTFKEAQEDMRKSYFKGGPEAFASGIIPIVIYNEL